MLLRQFLEPCHLSVALALLGLFLGASFFFRLLASLPLHRDARFRILLDSLSLCGLLGGIAQGDLARAHFDQCLVFRVLARLTFGIEL